MKNVKKKRELLLTILLVILFVVLQFVLQLSTVLNIVTYKGVLTSLQYGTCLLMILVNRKSGTKVGVTLMTISSIALVFIILHGERSAIPGLCNSIFYIITIILISRYDVKKEEESKTDMITGVNNRKGIYIELQEKIYKNQEFNIIYLSLDNFKAINDSYGHAYGDELLRIIAKRIEAEIGEGCSLARVGGVDFVIAVDNKIDITETANKLIKVISEKAVLEVDEDRVDCYMVCYAGISNYPKDANDYESLIKYADIAMTCAMADKSMKAYVFDKEMADYMNRQVQVGNLIKEGLQKDYFYLVYQPQYEVYQKELRGFETLIRMKTESGDIVSPGEFIPVAEKSDLILQIDDYVLTRAMTEFKDVVAKNPELTVSVNVSAKNFADENFVEKVKRIVNNVGFPFENLEIEITEYCMVNSMKTSVANINALRDLGVKIALDDFGTGYTSLSYVSTLPIDLLKIDKSLIDDIDINRKRRDFVRAVINMGQLMECEVLSEGVENNDQISCLRADGCDYVQGFVWSRPLPYEDALKLV